MIQHLLEISNWSVRIENNLVLIFTCLASLELSVIEFINAFVIMEVN